MKDWGTQIYLDRARRPSVLQHQALLDATTLARRMLGVLPPFRAFFFAAEPREPRGITCHCERPVLVFLRADLDHDQVFETMLHELQHVADSPLDLTVDERECRAEAFTQRALGRAAAIRAEIARLEAGVRR